MPWRFVQMRLVTLGLFCLTAGSSLLAADYRFVSIDAPDSIATGARSISARGDIVGSILDADFNQHGYLLRDGRFTQIDYPEAVATTPHSINNVGDITGRHLDSEGNESGFILRDGVFHDVHIPGGGTSDMWSVQANGQVMVGDAAMSFDGGALHGFIRNKAGEFRLIDFPGLPFPCTGPR